jgi:DNA polymerase III sliding clamp (beta) subunit (PCNA family)
MTWREVPMSDKAMIHSGGPRPTSTRLPPVRPPAWDEIRPRPDVEVLTPEQMRQQESLKPPPPPRFIFERAGVGRPTIVPPVEVATEPFLGLLVAVGQIIPVSPAAPAFGNVKITYKPYRPNSPTGGRFFLETSSGSSHAMASLPAAGGEEEWAVVFSLQRGVSVLKRLSGEFSSVMVGIDAEQVSIGPYSFPFGGPVGEFPSRDPFLTVEARAALPSYYLDSIIERVAPAVATEMNRAHLAGVHIDFRDKKAVATDGARLHVLQLPRMGVESMTPASAPSVTLEPAALHFLQAAANREWVAMQINEQQIAAFGDDYGLVGRITQEGYPEWRAVIPAYEGFWMLDKTAFIAALKPAATATEGLLTIDALTNRLTISVHDEHKDAMYTKDISAKRMGTAPAAVRLAVTPRYLLEAVTACIGGLIQLAFAKDDVITHAPMVVSGEDPEFIAVIMPRKS